MNHSRTCAHLGSLLAVVFGVLLAGPSVEGAIIGINSPGSSNASITFDDTFSFDPLLNPGTTLGGPAVSPWNGATVSLGLTTDAVTFDTASGDIDATFLGNAYAINLSNVLLNQFGANTGIAHLTFLFNVEFQLDAAGLPTQPTLFPNFIVNGTVQNTSGSFAALAGWIDYVGVDASGVYSVLETVNYFALWTTPGNFSATVTGVPVNGSTPLLPANSTLTLNGAFVFQVDPASINAYTVQVPEVGSTILTIAGALSIVLLRKRRKSHTDH